MHSQVEGAPRVGAPWGRLADECATTLAIRWPLGSVGERVLPQRSDVAKAAGRGAMGQAGGSSAQRARLIGEALSRPRASLARIG